MEAIISIVEDDASLRTALQRVMQSHGFAVAAFPSAEEFLESGAVPDCACLVADIMMQGLSGIALHERLIAEGYRIPTILMTACPSFEDRSRALAAGVVSYRSKPLSENALVDDVRTALARSRRGPNPG